MGEVKNFTTVELLVFVFLTMMISGASSIANNDFIKILAMGVLFVYNSLNRKPLYNSTLFYILCGWIFINLLSSLYFGKNIELYQFVGKTILVYISYLILTCCNDNFWEKYENFLYKVVVVSSFIYILSLLMPVLFNSLTPIFKPFTDDFFYLKESQKHYFYAFFFVYKGGETLFRNNGFMWEPGAYAMMLNILIAYNLGRYGIHLNKHIKIYVIALLTTFSTAGYLSLLSLMILFFLQVQNVYIKVLVVVGGIISISWFANLDFLLPKIEQFIESAEKGKVNHQGYRQLYEANRILSFKLLLDKFLMFPLGWGCIQDTSSYMALRRIVTVNGLGNILVTWGIFGFSFFMYSIYRFFNQYSRSILVGILSLLSVLLLFFSNPIENNILFFLLVLSPYVLTNSYEP